MKPKTKFPPTGRWCSTSLPVAEGEGRGPTISHRVHSSPCPVPSCSVSSPPELQSYTGFSAGVGTGAKEAGGRQGPHQFFEGARGRTGAQGERHGAHHSVIWWFLGCSQTECMLS